MGTAHSGWGTGLGSKPVRAAFFLLFFSFFFFSQKSGAAAAVRAAPPPTVLGTADETCVFWSLFFFEHSFIVGIFKLFISPSLDSGYYYTQ